MSKLESVYMDLDKWIANLEWLCQCLKNMQHTISNEDFMMHILNNLPKEYDNLVEALEPTLGATANGLMVQYLREHLRAKYQHLQWTQKDDTKKKMALTTQNGCQQTREK